MIYAGVRYALDQGLLVPAIQRRYESGMLVTQTDDSPEIEPGNPGWVYARLAK